MIKKSDNFSYNNVPWEVPFKPSQETQIKNHMEKISIGLLITFLLITVITLIVTFLNPYALLDSNNELYTLFLYVLNGIGLTFAMPIGAVVICKLLKTNLRENVAVKKSRAKNTLLIVLGGLGVCMIANFMVEILIFLFSFTGIDITVGTDIDSPPATVINMVIMIFSTALVPAFVEELLFRGAILGVMRKFGDNFAIVISALLFGLLHGNLVQAPFAFAVGLVLAYSVVYTGSIIPAMIIHFCNNAISVVFSAISMEMSENLFAAIYYLVCTILIFLGIISIFIIAKNDKSFLKTVENDNMENSFKACMIFALTEPWTIVFTVLMIASCILTIASGLFV